MRALLQAHKLCRTKANVCFSDLCEALQVAMELIERLAVLRLALLLDALLSSASDGLAIKRRVGRLRYGAYFR